MHIVVNGKMREVPASSTVAELIETLGLKARNVVIERNGHPVDRAMLRTVKLEPGDVVEVVRPVPGG